jgi:hypothetical protein
MEVVRMRDIVSMIVAVIGINYEVIAVCSPFEEKDNMLSIICAGTMGRRLLAKLPYLGTC